MLFWADEVYCFYELALFILLAFDLGSSLGYAGGLEAF